MSLCRPLFVGSYIHLQWFDGAFVLTLPKVKKELKNKSVDIMKHFSEIIVIQTLLPSSLPCQFTACFNARFKGCFLRL